MDVLLDVQTGQLCYYDFYSDICEVAIGEE